MVKAHGAGLEFSAANEREALAETVAAFKQRVAGLVQEKSRIPWVDPPAEPAPDEQQRFVPIHL